MVQDFDARKQLLNQTGTPTHTHTHILPRNTHKPLPGKMRTGCHNEDLVLLVERIRLKQPEQKNLNGSSETLGFEGS